MENVFWNVFLVFNNVLIVFFWKVFRESDRSFEIILLMNVCIHFADSLKSL